MGPIHRACSVLVVTLGLFAAQASGSTCELGVCGQVVGDYQLLTLTSDTMKRVYGLDSSGAVILYQSLGLPACNELTGPCYITYSNGTLVSVSPTPPPVTTQPIGPPGPGCFAPPSSAHIILSTCNNGYELYFAQETGGPFYSLYDGPNLTGLLLTHVDPLTAFFSENSFGDFAFDDVFRENILETYNVTAHAPEPGGLLLLGTGMLAAMAAFRRQARVGIR